MSSYTFETLLVDISASGVAHVEINRPKNLNAFSHQTWQDIGRCFAQFKSDGNVRCIVLSAAGRMFTAGLDLKDAMKRAAERQKEDGSRDVARKGYYQRLYLLEFQDALTQVETCDKPVISVVHGACIGIGVDLNVACDIRIASEDAYYCVKEVDIGMAADIGTLQRLPKVVGNDSWVRDICYTARNVPAKEAQAFGLVSNVYKTKDESMKAAFELAETIASKSPVAVVSTKHLLNYSRDHTVQEGLEYTALWNALAHNSKDMGVAMMASLQKQKATFPKL
ncbi:ClpP/crotonase [Linderina pennispora]|uniref:ClpP/crotonase n=1 Tax=Linderina pennispora TaxID=61395 RepID=A0A1Y1W189_9FUNG|nr:ClpP/crotonase [Linderina pennispora]ORX67065.1 ClpP/crotonase [Linderina pennispora]